MITSRLSCKKSTTWMNQTKTTTMMVDMGTKLTNTSRDLTYNAAKLAILSQNRFNRPTSRPRTSSRRSSSADNNYLSQLWPSMKCQRHQDAKMMTSAKHSRQVSSLSRRRCSLNLHILVYNLSQYPNQRSIRLHRSLTSQLYRSAQNSNLPVLLITLSL